MDTILKFIMSHQYIFIIAVIVFGVTLVGYFAELKRPKKIKNQVDEEAEMRKKIFELKNSPLANNKIASDDTTSIKL